MDYGDKDEHYNPDAKKHEVKNSVFMRASRVKMKFDSIFDSK